MSGVRCPHSFDFSFAAEAFGTQFLMVLPPGTVSYVPSSKVTLWQVDAWRRDADLNKHGAGVKYP